MKKIYLNWAGIESYIDTLAYKIAASGKQVTVIHGLSRGGLIPAVLLSHKLGIPYVNDWPILKHLYDPKTTLIVDDICDSGKTLKPYTDYITVTLHHKTTAIVEPTFWVKTVEENEWTCYPWEDKESQTIQDYKL